VREGMQTLLKMGVSSARDEINRAHDFLSIAIEDKITNDEDQNA